jgi:putative salt-induced outer membrane protein
MHQPAQARFLTAAALLAGVLAPAFAFGQAPPPPPRQEGSAELAFVGTSGNASTSTFSAGAEHIARPPAWMIRNRAHFVRSAAEDTVTAESLLYAFRAERSINDRLSAFGDLGLFRDEPAGISSRAALTGGLAFKVVASARQTLALDAGLGYLDEHRLTGTNISSAVYSGGETYKLKLSDTADLSDDLRLLGTFDRGEDWRLDHTIALTAKLTTLLSLKVSNQIRFANFPPPGFKKTDTTTAVALVAGFKRQ